MYTYLALLRGINVSGQKKIKMAELKQHFSHLGFENVQTYIQSGNLVFRHPEPDHGRVEEIISAEVEKTFGFEIGVWVRRHSAYLSIVTKNPYNSLPNEEKSGLYFVFLNQIPSPERITKLELENFANETFRITEECIYLYCHAGYGKAKCNNNFFEGRLKVQATTRNLRTVETLLKMSDELEKQN